MHRSFAVALLAACAGSPIAPASAAAPDPPGAVLIRFLADVEKGDMDGAYALLSAARRAVLSPEKLRQDLQAGGALAQDRLARVRAAASAQPLMAGQAALFPTGGGRAARLVPEAAGWRVDTLDAALPGGLYPAP